MKNNRQLIMNIFWILLGTVLLIVSVTGRIDNMYTGFGGGLIAVGVVQLIRAIRYKTDIDYQNKVNVEVSDERNKYIRMKAWSWAGYLFVMITGVATLVCMILSQAVYMQIASGVLCLILVLYWVAYLVIRRKN